MAPNGVHLHCDVLKCVAAGRGSANCVLKRKKTSYKSADVVKREY